jgi:hypothetical protein
MPSKEKLVIVDQSQGGLFVGVGYKGYSPVFEDVNIQDAEELMKRWNSHDDLVAETERLTKELDEARKAHEACHFEHERTAKLSAERNDIIERLKIDLEKHHRFNEDGDCVVDGCQAHYYKERPIHSGDCWYRRKKLYEHDTLFGSKDTPFRRELVAALDRAKAFCDICKEKKA